MPAFDLTTTPKSLSLKPGSTGTIVVVMSNRLGKPVLGRIDGELKPAGHGWLARGASRAAAALRGGSCGYSGVRVQGQRKARNPRMSVSERYPSSADPRYPNRAAADIVWPTSSRTAG
jgi:hypothetical protein